MKAGFLRGATCVSFALIVLSSSAHADPLAAQRIAPGEIKWEQEQSGVQRARLVGDDKKPGIYVYRVRFPAGHKVQPHFHPDERVVTILSGTLYLGYGEKFDESTMKALPPGSLWTEPAKQPHFVFARDGEVEFEVVGSNGPSGVIRIETK
jgi:quercetin dioxygenase-like cupin family protein